MNEIGIFNQTEEEILELDDIYELLKFAAQKMNLDSAIFNVIIVGNDEIRDINKNYRNKDSVTDVISFALEEVKDIEYDFRLLGDIYISLDRTKEQAEEYGHSFLRELAFLSIHGFLHLLGYDHMEEKEEKIMIEKQKEILNEYGITKWTKKDGNKKIF